MASTPGLKQLEKAGVAVTLHPYDYDSRADAVGLAAAAEGVVEILDLSRERYEAWFRHAAEEAGEEFDPAEVGDGPFRIVRLRGRGARIHDA